MRTCTLTLLFVAGLPLLVASAPASSPEAPPAVNDESMGCYLNFSAENKGRSSVLVDIQNSRIKQYGLNWTRIKNTSNVNVGAGKTRHFGVWAKICGGTHIVRVRLKRGADTKMVRRWHFKGRTSDFGDLNSYFN